MKTQLWSPVQFLAIFSAATLLARADSAGPSNWNFLRGVGPAKFLSGMSDNDLNGRDSDGNCALHVAALHGRAEVFRLLLERGADPNATNSFGAVPLLYAPGDYQK